MHLPSGYIYIRSKFLNNNLERHQLFILVLTFVVYGLYHASRKPLSVVKTVFHKPCLQETNRDSNWCQWKPFHTDNWSQLVGGLEYAFLLSYAVAMFPCGHLAERIDLRKFLAIGMASSGMTTILFGLGYYLDIHLFNYYLVVQILGGITQATGWPAVVTILSNWFGKGRRGLIMGIWNANTNAGNMVGSVVAGYFVNIQWGASFLVPGFVLSISGFLILYLIVDRPCPQMQLTSTASSVNSSQLTEKPKQHPGYYKDIKNITDAPNFKEQPISFMSALCLPNVLAYSFALFFSKLVSYTFLYWLPNFLSSVSIEPVSAERAALLSTIFDLGGICGGILAGLMSDNTGADLLSVSPQDASTRTIYLRAVTCSAMLAVAAPTLLIYKMIAANNSFYSLSALFVCGALVTGPCALITTAVAADLGTQPSLQGNSRALATVTAIIDGTGSLGAALGPFLTGILVYHGWLAVFIMLITADLCALAISLNIAFRSRQGGKVLQVGTLSNL